MIGILIWQLAIMFIPMGNYIIPISMVLTFGVYVYYGIYKKQMLTALKYNWCLTAFVLAGGLWCIMSLCGMAGWFDLTRDFGVNLSYLPRQAYYFAYLPLIAFAPFFKVDKSLEFLKKYNNEIILMLYTLFCIKAKTIHILPINDFLILAFLSLLGSRERKTDWIVFASLLLMPLHEYGGSTILLLKIIYSGLFIFKNARWVMKLATLTIPVILVASFVAPQFSQVVDEISDVNAKWRLQIWEDDIRAIIDSYGLGIGYGTTYASKEFTAPQAVGLWLPNYNMWSETPFSENDRYTKEQRPFVTASHNSFVSIGLRMGVIGVTLFCGALFKIWKKLYRRICKEQTAMTFIFCGVLIMISLNVGLESPGYFQIFMNVMCIVNLEYGKKANSEEMNGEIKSKAVDYNYPRF